MPRSARLTVGIFICVGAVLYVVSVQRMQNWHESAAQDGLRVALPGYVSVLFAAGDRHLAANIAVFRSMMVGAFAKDPLTYRIQGKLQRQAAILNPYQEDNYYVAAAILPWEGQVDYAQFVLAQATEARTWDWMPPFFQGFNSAYFNHNYRQAGKLAQTASERAAYPNNLLLKDIAAKWYSRQHETKAAISMLAALREASKDERMKRRLDLRIEQLRGLVTLKKAAAAYKKAHDRSPSKLTDLVVDGQLTALPRDPLGQGYALDAAGNPGIRRSAKESRQ